jgi:hypothetical protein
MAELWLDRLAERKNADDTSFGLEASIAKMKASDVANAPTRRRRSGADARRLRLMQRLRGRAPHARRQNHPDLGRHEPGPSSANRTELRSKMTKTIKTVGFCGAGGTMGAGIALVAARGDFTTVSPIGPTTYSRQNYRPVFSTNRSLEASSIAQSDTTSSPRCRRPPRSTVWRTAIW